MLRLDSSILVMLCLFEISVNSIHSRHGYLVRLFQSVDPCLTPFICPIIASSDDMSTTSAVDLRLNRPTDRRHPTVRLNDTSDRSDLRRVWLSWRRLWWFGVTISSCCPCSCSCSRTSAQKVLQAQETAWQVSSLRRGECGNLNFELCSNPSTQWEAHLSVLPEGWLLWFHYCNLCILVFLPCHASSGLLFKGPRFGYAFTMLLLRCLLVSPSVIRVPCLLRFGLVCREYIYRFTQCDTGIGASLDIVACHGHTLLQKINSEGLQGCP